jgi:hypothetical protein
MSVHFILYRKDKIGTVLKKFGWLVTIYRGYFQLFERMVETALLHFPCSEVETRMNLKTVDSCMVFRLLIYFVFYFQFAMYWSLRCLLCVSRPL